MSRNKIEFKRPIDFICCAVVKSRFTLSENLPQLFLDGKFVNGAGMGNMFGAGEDSHYLPKTSIYHHIDL